jgi:hypothetical protein
MPRILSPREQARVVNDVLQKRFDDLLPAVMRECGFDMWLIICNEDNHDPVFRTMIPWESWTPILQILVFYDAGIEKGVERLNLSMTEMNGMMAHVWDYDSTEEQWQCLDYY